MITVAFAECYNVGPAGLQQPGPHETFPRQEVARWAKKLAGAWRSLLPVAVTAVLATGCQTYQQQNKVVRYWQQGDLPQAAAEATHKADKNAGNKDAIIWRLEQGSALRAVGRYQDSNQAFDQAQAKMDDYAQKAKVRLSQESAAMFSNQATLDYEGRAYDGIMLNTYEALNYLALGEPDKARPELIHAYFRQQDAVAANKKRIQEAQDAAAQSKDSEYIARAQQDPGLQAQLAGATTNLDVAGMSLYADYVNPFTVYLDGLYFMANATDVSDLERARKSLDRVISFVPDNVYVKQDLASTDGLIHGQPLTPTTYVIFETGCAPQRSQIRIDIPIIVSKVSYVGAAFPTLKFEDNYMPFLTVSANGTVTSTMLVASMDAVIAQDFKNELPVIITKTIIATVVKGVAAYAANSAAQNAGGDLGGLLTQLGTAVYQLAVNIADERTWTTLPKQFQVARIPTPANRTIDLITPAGMKTSVTIGPGDVNVVYVKSINEFSPLLISQFKLK
jgi:uncharacterized protein